MTGPRPDEFMKPIVDYELVPAGWFGEMRASDLPGAMITHLFRDERHLAEFRRRVALKTPKKAENDAAVAKALRAGAVAAVQTYDASLFDLTDCWLRQAAERWPLEPFLDDRLHSLATVTRLFFSGLALDEPSPAHPDLDDLAPLLASPDDLLPCHPKAVLWRSLFNLEISH